MIATTKVTTKLFPRKPRTNLHNSLKFILVLAQVFGYFPVQGVLEDDVNKLSFTWKSIRVFSSILTAFIGTMIAIGHVRRIVTVTGYEQHQMNAIVFYTCGSMSCLLFIKVASEWREIMQKWSALDKAMVSYGWPHKLNQSLRRISIIFLTLEAAEHFLIQANKLIVAVHCRESFSKGFEHFAVTMSFSMVFDTIPYNPLLAIILQCMNTRMAFSWTFIDLFIILMSSALAARFAQVNQRIQHYSDLQKTDPEEWRALNADYNRLCTFSEYINDKISFLVLVSFFNNFYFIIFIVDAGLTSVRATALEMIYYLISLGLLVLRMTCICVYANRVHAQSKMSLDTLVSLPIDSYNEESPFLIISFQIVEGVLAYELVLIQFNKKMPKKEEPSLYSLC